MAFVKTNRRTVPAAIALRPKLRTMAGILDACFFSLSTKQQPSTIPNMKLPVCGGSIIQLKGLNNEISIPMAVFEGIKIRK